MTETLETILREGLSLDSLSLVDYEELLETITRGGKKNEQ